MNDMADVMENLKTIEQTNDFSLADIAHIFHNLTFILFILNITIYVICMKKRKFNSKILLILILLSFIISNLFKIVSETGGGAVDDYGNSIADNTPLFIMIILFGIIQLFAFVKLIIKIVRNNKKKEENQSCQE